MATIHNKSRGVRVINAAGPDGSPRQLVIEPGQTVEAEVFNTDDPVFQGFVERGELVVARYVRIGALLEQQAHHPIVTVMRGAHQCRYAVLVPRINIHAARQDAGQRVRVAGLSHTP